MTPNNYTLSITSSSKKNTNQSSNHGERQTCIFGVYILTYIMNRKAKWFFSWAHKNQTHCRISCLKVTYTETWQQLDQTLVTWVLYWLWPRKYNFHHLSWSCLVVCNSYWFWQITAHCFWRRYILSHYLMSLLYKWEWHYGFLRLVKLPMLSEQVYRYLNDRNGCPKLQNLTKCRTKSSKTKTITNMSD